MNELYRAKNLVPGLQSENNRFMIIHNGPVSETGSIVGRVDTIEDARLRVDIAKSSEGYDEGRFMIVDTEK